MANLTITVDAETLKRARLRAVERGESVNQYLADRLRDYAAADQQATRKRLAAHRFVALTRELSSASDGAGWTREELYEERIGRSAAGTSEPG